MRVVHVVVTGRVQGVGFRNWTVHTAEPHGLEGWVRNRANGSVEAVFAGGAEAVLAMVEACRHGPSGARVDDLVLNEATEAALAARGTAKGFVWLATV